MRVRYYLILFLMLSGGCGYDKLEIDPGPNAGDRTLPNMRMADLRGYYRGEPLTLNRNIVVAGYVTATDRSGNFYRTFLIEDESGAVEIMAGLYDLHNIYHLNQRIVVRAEGLTLGCERGVLQLGLAASENSSYETDYFGHRLVMERYVYRDSIFCVSDPRVVPISELTEDLCGSLLKIENLVADEPGEYWGGGHSPDGTPLTGYRCFRDSAGDSIYVETSGYANFAGRLIPEDVLSLTGILLQGSREGKVCYMLKLRDEKDVESN